jgi:hypothetical protein
MASRGWIADRIGDWEKTCKVPDPKYVAVDDDIPEDEDVLDPSISTNKR